MADFTVTISNNLYAFGDSPSTQWGNFLWGEGFWGEGSADLATSVEKLLENTIDSSDAKYLSAEVVVSNSIDTLSETTSEDLKNGVWNYVFTGPTSDNENKSISTYVAASDPNRTWASAATVTTVWSEP